MKNVVYEITLEYDEHLIDGYRVLLSYSNDKAVKPFLKKLASKYYPKGNLKGITEVDNNVMYIDTDNIHTKIVIVTIGELDDIFSLS